MELREGARPGVRERAAHTGRDHVQQVLDGRPQRVQVDARARDALGEELLAGELVRVEPLEPALHRLRGRHAPALLVEAAVRVAVEHAGRLDRPGEPGADHDGCATGGERQRDVAGVAHTAVRPDVRPELARGGAGLEHRGELRAADGGHHARRAHRAGADADLQDVRARRDEVADGLLGDDVPRDDRQAETQLLDGADRADHAVLVTVRRVDDEHVDARCGERLRLAGHVAVDADRRGDAEPAVRIQRRRVDGGAEGAALRQRSDDTAVVEDRREVDAGRIHHLERRAPIGEVLRIERGQGAVQQVADPRVGERRPELDGRKAAEVRAVVAGDDDAVPFDGRDAAEHVGDALIRVGLVRGVEHHRLRLHPADRLVEVLQVHVLREDAETAATGEGGGEPLPGDRVHVRGHDRDGRAGAVVGGEGHVETARDVRPRRHEEDIRVGEIVARRCSIELHGNNAIPLG